MTTEHHVAPRWFFVAGIGMAGFAVFFAYYSDWPSVVLNVLGAIAVTGYAVYRLRRS